MSRVYKGRSDGPLEISLNLRNKEAVLLRGTRPGIHTNRVRVCSMRRTLLLVQVDHGLFVNHSHMRSCMSTFLLTAPSEPGWRASNSRGLIPRNVVKSPQQMEQTGTP